MKSHYGRFIIQLDAERVDDLGFLDPERCPRLLQPIDLLSRPLTWIVGRPWIGKSTFARHLYNEACLGSDVSEDMCTFVELTSLGSNLATTTIPPSWWHQWLASQPSKAVWLIDGVDECVENSAYLLESIAVTIARVPDEHRKCLRLIIFSRPYDSLNELRERLEERYHSISHTTFHNHPYWLARMDRAGASLLVGQERFQVVIEIIQKNELQSVAGYPIVLKFLAQYHDINQRLTTKEVWAGVLKSLLGSTRQNISYTSTLEERFYAACRIATVMTLTGRNRIRTWSPSKDEPTISMLYHNPTNALNNAAQESCRTALFTPVINTDEFQFVQRNAQDWLTAFGLIRLPLPTLRSVLQDSAGVLDIRLAEIARLIRAVCSDALTITLINKIVARPLLPTDALEPTLQDVVAIIDQLETLADSSPWGIRSNSQIEEGLSRLRIDGVDEILAQRLNDPRRSSKAKDLLIDIAEATQAVKAVEAAVNLVLDETQDDEIRYSAMWMIVKLGGEAHLRSLEVPIGESKTKQEIDLRIRGVLISALLKQQIWPCWRAALNSPAIDHDLIDSRKVLLHTLEKTMTLCDARRLLPHIGELWERHRSEEYPNRLPDFISVAISLVLQEEQVSSDDLSHLIQLVQTLVERDQEYPMAFELALRLKRFPVARRKLFEYYQVGHKSLRAFYILAPEDWKWLVQNIPLKLKTDRGLWGHVFSLAKEARVKGIIADSEWEDLCQFMDQEVPGLRTQFENSRLQQIEERLLANEGNQEDESEVRLESTIATVIAKVGLSPQQIMRELSWHCFVNSGDFINVPGEAWHSLSEELRHLVINRCCLGLQEGQPARIRSSNSLSGAVLAEGSAFIQVLDSTRIDDWLTGSLVERWLPTALITRLSGEWDFPINKCFSVFPSATQKCIVSVIKFFSNQEEPPFKLRQIPALCWTDEMTSILEQKVNDQHTPTAVRTELLVHLAIRNSEKTGPIAETWAKRSYEENELDILRQTGINLLLVLNSDLALSLIEEVARTHGNKSLEKLSILWDWDKWIPLRIFEWPIATIERLATVLLIVYPLPQESDFRGGFVSPDQELRLLRDRLVNALLERDSSDASVSNDRLSQVDKNFNALLLSQRANRKVEGYLPISTQQIGVKGTKFSLDTTLRLLDKQDYRLIRSTGDLLDAILESLDKIQSTIGEDLPMLYSAPTDKKPRRHLFEDALQTYVRRRLLNELTIVAENVEVVAYREDQVSRRQRLDIRVTAPCYGDQSLAQVVIEVKWSDNLETKSGLVDQLGKRYLLGENLTHGVFLVGWSGEWSPGDGSGKKTDISSLVNYLEKQRDEFCSPNQPGSNTKILPYVLNAQWNLES